MLIRYPPPPRTVTVNKENYYLEYKGDKKWLSLISSHFAMKLCAKYQKAWYMYKMHYLSTSKISYLKANRNK